MTLADESIPLVTCIVPTTKKRQLFWPMLFQCFQKQTWSNKKLVLVSEDPVECELPPKTEVIAVPPGLSIGAKMNIGVRSSEGNYFWKGDDDDLYHKNFLSTAIPPLLLKTPSVSMTNRYLILFLKDWELYYLPKAGCAGGTICFSRDAWKNRPFEDLSYSEDWNFIKDRDHLVIANSSQLLATYMIVRHGSNSWSSWEHTDKSVDTELMKCCRKLSRGPECFLTPEDVVFYQKLRITLFD
jgi:hypothetical protein